MAVPHVTLAFLASAKEPMGSAADAQVVSGNQDSIRMGPLFVNHIKASFSTYKSQSPYFILANYLLFHFILAFCYENFQINTKIESIINLCIFITQNK
jgi:hypothetical protein